MAAPSQVPTDPTRPRAYQSPPRRAGSWSADRPGDIVGAAQPKGPALGNQGPDQGYMLKLAAQVRDDLVLAPGEQADDVLAGASAVALRRASMYGRAPIAHDLRIALELFGFLGPAPDELVEWRRGRFDELHHTTIHYARVRELADLVPEATLRLTPDAVAAGHDADWRELLGVSQVPGPRAPAT